MCVLLYVYLLNWIFFFQAEDGIRDLVRSRGLGDVYKRQVLVEHGFRLPSALDNRPLNFAEFQTHQHQTLYILSLIHI